MRPGAPSVFYRTNAVMSQLPSQVLIVVAFGALCFGCGYLTALIVTRNKWRDGFGIGIEDTSAIAAGGRRPAPRPPCTHAPARAREIIGEFAPKSGRSSPT
jgi:hypothetical protein